MVGYDSYRDPYNDRLAYQINPYIIGQQPKKNKVQYRHQQKHRIEHSFKFEWPPAETQKKVFRTSAYVCWISKERLTANPSHGNPYPSFLGFILPISFSLNVFNLHFSMGFWGFKGLHLKGSEHLQIHKFSGKAEISEFQHALGSSLRQLSRPTVVSGEKVVSTCQQWHLGSETLPIYHKHQTNVGKYTIHGY